MKWKYKTKVALKSKLILGVVLAMFLCTGLTVVHFTSSRIPPKTGVPSAFSSLSANEPANANDDKLHDLLKRDDGNIDLALANWLIVEDVPEFIGLTQKSFLERIDAETELVKAAMDRMQSSGYGGTDPNDPKTRCRQFCSAIIGLNFGYAQEFREENFTKAQLASLYANPNDLFLAGLLQTRQGSCVSIPLLYLVIGQQLGMPVHLVALGKHFFIRWEEPGLRMNIETTSTSKIAWTPDDSVYLDIEGMKPDQLRGSDLRNLSNREVVGELFFTRMSYWHAKGPKYEDRSLNDLAVAHKLASEDPAIERAFDILVNHKSLSEYSMNSHSKQ